MKRFISDYLNEKIKLEKYQIIGILCFIFAIGGFFGWVYEYIFYFFNSGMKEFYWRGGNFLPWINIYAIGSIMIIFATYKFKKKPWLVFLISVITTGLLEYFSGLVIFKFFGKRFWDYNTEILNFGNLDGYICFRSVFFFGLSALLLMYVLLPFGIYLSKKLNKKTFLILSITLFTIVLCDEFYNLLFARLLNLPRSYDIYSRFGLKYMNVL